MSMVEYVTEVVGSLAQRVLIMVPVPSTTVDVRREPQPSRLEARSFLIENRVTIFGIVANQPTECVPLDGVFVWSYTVGQGPCNPSY